MPPRKKIRHFHTNKTFRLWKVLREKNGNKKLTIQFFSWRISVCIKKLRHGVETEEFSKSEITEIYQKSGSDLTNQKQLAVQLILWLSSIKLLLSVA